MQYSVWLFTRPLSYAAYFSSVEGTSEGRHHLRHWGILVTEMKLADTNAIILRSRQSGRQTSQSRGVMYELFREPNNLNNVKSTSPFQISTIMSEWPTFSAQ